MRGVRQTFRTVGKTRRFQRTIFHEIIKAYTLSEKFKHWQAQKLAHALSTPKHNLTSPDVSSSMALSECAPDAFRLVPLNSMTLLYTKCARNGRPYQVWLYNHKQSSHQMLFEESTPSCTVDVALTRDREYVTINSNSRTSSEVSIIKSHYLIQKSYDISKRPVLLRPRQEHVEYYVEHAHSKFYIFTNLGHNTEYKLMTADSSAPHMWTNYYQPQYGVVLQDVEFYEKAVLLYGLREGVPVVIVIYPNEEDNEPVILSRADYTHIDKRASEEEGLDGLHSYKSECWPVWFSSPVSSSSLYTINVNRTTAVYGSDQQVSAGRYCIERTHALSKDDVEVPMTLCYCEDLVQRDHTNPVLVHVYGSYGECVHTGYQPENEPLLSRGWVLVYCHVRGGGERGRGWYHWGMGERKCNTFEDLYACVRELHTGLSQPRLTALTGRSAGGQAVGMFCNLWPHLLQAAILQVPLVNLMYSLSDPSLYLASKDYLEFGGNPLASNLERDHISSICPYWNLKPQDYPAMYISAARPDEVIPFKGVEDYVSKLKECIAHYHKPTNDGSRYSRPWTDKLPSLASKMDKFSLWSHVTRGSVFFNVDNLYGHYGNGDMKERVNEVSNQEVFLYKALQMKLM